MTVAGAALFLLVAGAAASPGGVTTQKTLTEGVAKPVLRGGRVGAVKPVLHAANATQVAVAMSATNRSKRLMKSAPPCSCQVSNPEWRRTARTAPKCIFIDLGAADGNSFASFLNNGYGPVSNCPGGGAYEAWLVEANPLFNDKLQAVETQHRGQVHILSSTAAYMCEAQTSFFLDTVNKAHNYWGSSMASNHRDVQASGKTKVTVPTTNLMRMIYENAIPGDWVMVKMDIEGAEWDVIPCLAKSQVAGLVDRLYLEEHPQDWSLTGTSPYDFEVAKDSLRKQHVDIPKYFSQTL